MIDHRPLVAIHKKDVTILLQRLQCILLRICQYRERIIYESVPDLFIADWLSRQNHKEGKDGKILDMKINIDAMRTRTDILNCMTIQQQATTKENYLQ